MYVAERLRQTLLLRSDRPPPFVTTAQVASSRSPLAERPDNQQTVDSVEPVAMPSAPKRKRKTKKRGSRGARRSDEQNRERQPAQVSWARSRYKARTLQLMLAVDFSNTCNLQPLVTSTSDSVKCFPV